MYIGKRNEDFVWKFQYTSNHNQFDTYCDVLILLQWRSSGPKSGGGAQTFFQKSEKQKKKKKKKKKKGHSGV